jgi:hypothetical protein
MFAVDVYAKRVVMVLSSFQFVFALSACGALGAAGVKSDLHSWAYRFGTAVSTLCVAGAMLHVIVRGAERTHRAYDVLSAALAVLTLSAIIELVCFKNAGAAAGLWDLGTCLLVMAFAALTARFGVEAIEERNEVQVSYELKCNTPWTNELY